MEHPLENHLVLGNLLQYISIEEDIQSIKVIRLVCKAWLKASQPLWNSLVDTLKIIIKPSIKLSEDKAVITLKDLRKCYDDPKSNYRRYPSRNYELIEWTIKDTHFSNYSYCCEVENEEENENDEFIHWFWGNHSLLITGLTFTNCYFNGSFVFFSERFLRCVPHLIKLEVISCQINWEELTKPDKDQWLSLSSNHQNSWYFSRLKVVKIVDLNLEEGNDGTIIWNTLFSLTTNLERLILKGIDKGEGLSILDDKLIFLADCLQSCGPPKLKCLDILEFLEFPEKRPQRMDYFHLFSRDWNFSLENLSFDLTPFGISCYSTMETDDLIIARHSRSLKRMGLFKSPFFKPFYLFPCPNPFPVLEELYLWGNICSSLDFLRWMPNLKVLVWRSSCYEMEGHGGRIHGWMKEGKRVEKASALFLGDGVLRRTEWEEDIRLEGMRRLEMDFKGGKKYWRELGRWMPNLRELKVVVEEMGDLGVVGKVWEELEKLEIGHGSTGICFEGILEVVRGEGLGKLKEFRWRGCACCCEDGGSGGNREEVEKALGELVGGPENFTVPWKGGQEWKGTCLQSEFEMALISGNSRNFFDLI